MSSRKTHKTSPTWGVTQCRRSRWPSRGEQPKTSYRWCDVNCQLCWKDSLLGATVSLRGRKTRAIVTSVRVTIGGRRVSGGVILDRPLGGLRYWNVEELVRRQPLPKLIPKS